MITLNNLLRHLFFLLQFCQILYARSGSGNAYHRGSYVHSSGHHPRFVWFPHMHGHRVCDEDDTDCQESSSVQAIDVVILAILIIASVCCCCICAAYAKKKNRSWTMSHGTESDMTTENYNSYVSMQDPQQRCGRSVVPFDQEQRPNQVVVVQGQMVPPSTLVEMARHQPKAAPQIV